MEFSKWLILNEMPASIKKVGNWQSPYSDEEDRRANSSDDAGNWDRKSYTSFTNRPKAVKKMYRILQGTLQDFAIYFYRNPDRVNFSGRDGRMIDGSEINQMYESLGISPEEAPIVPGKINVFLLKWNAEPPSAWMVMHRFAHAASPLYMARMHYFIDDQIERDPSGRMTRYDVLKNALTMRSARHGNIENNSRGHDEMMREIFTQYIISHKVRLKKNSSFENFIKDIGGLEKGLNQICQEAFQGAEKYVFVM